MGKQSPKVQYNKVLPLAPVAQPSLETFSFLPKNITRNPLLPIVIGLLFTGFGPNMVSTLAALAICFLWVWADLFPVARFIGIWTTNHFFHEYHSHLEGFGRRETESKRERLRVVTTSISFLLFFGILFAGFARITKWQIKRYQVIEQQEIANRIEAVASTDSTGDPKFSFVNNSTHDITLLGIACHPRYAHTTVGLDLSDPTMIPSIGGTILIHGNGDGQSVTCSMQSGVFSGFGSFDCADMTWEIIYTLPDQPSQSAITGRYRFFLDPRTKEWSRIGLEAPPKRCPNESRQSAAQ